MPLREAFRTTIASLLEGASTVGVKVSGGLDSLAVLVRACEHRAGRRVVAFTVDIADDTGMSTVQVVRRLVRDLDLPCELVVVRPTAGRSARWSVHGPRLDAVGPANAAVAEAADAYGADVLLNGEAADELLGAPRYLSTSVARRGLGPLVQYLRDAGRSGPALPGELAAAASVLLPSARRARTYWAATWPELCQAGAADVLTDQYAHVARSWTREYIAEAIAEHAAAWRSWAEADAYDAFWPQDPLPPAGDVAEVSPYLSEPFLPAALATPLADRYDPRFPHLYWRAKALVIRLFDPHHPRVLPRRKQYFSAAIEAHCPNPVAAPRAVAAGLVHPERLARCRDLATRLNVAAIEDWLVGAEQAGALVPT